MVETRLRGNHIKAGMTVSATFFSGTLAINCTLLLDAKKNILKSNSFDVILTDFFAFTCKFGSVL